MMQSSKLSSANSAASELVLYLGGIGLFASMFFFFTHGLLNLIFAAMIASVLLLLSLVDKGRAVMLTIAYLILMGDIRRILTPITGLQKLDLLLVVGPGVACFLALPILLKVQLKDRLSKAMFAITVIMILQIFNPKQGGISVGLTGVIFNLAPILWFWVGRRYATTRVLETLIYKVLLPLAFAALMLGFFQTYIGFLPYEQVWIDAVHKAGYTSLFINSHKARSFGFSVSAAEYATLLSIGGVSAVATWWGRYRMWALTFPLFAVGIFLGSSRSALVKLILALTMIFFLRKGTRFSATVLLRLSFATVVALVLLSAGASLLPESNAEVQTDQSQTEQALVHEASGLAHPLDRSTAGMHGGMFVSGVLAGITSPLGAGLGSTTAAAGKFGVSGVSGNSEIDISDMFASLGVAGGVIYLYVVLAVMRSLFVYNSVVSRTISLPVVAILTGTLGGWLLGAQYSTATIVFFLIGGIVKSSLAMQESTVPLMARKGRADVLTAA